MIYALVGRDPNWTHQAMGTVWSTATKLNLEPLVWEIGFLNLRDLIKARDPHFQERDYRVGRLETAWGCIIRVICLYDHVTLVANDKGGPQSTIRRFTAGRA